MRLWIKVLRENDAALADFLDHLTTTIRAEDSLARVQTLDELHRQRGKVEALRWMVFAVTNKP
jgi:hypothetical protein